MPYVQTAPNYFTGFNSDDEIVGTDGDDLIYGSGGSDSLQGGKGNDEIWGDASGIALVGGNGSSSGGIIDLAPWGNDQLDGGPGNDILHGDQGDDTLVWTDGIDILHGDDGNDLLKAIGAVTVEYDSLDGGSGTDTALLQAKVHNFSAAHSRIELIQSDFGQINGTSGDDVIDLSAGLSANGVMNILGGDGNDTLTGTGGDDDMNGGAGNDLLFGGAGNDALAWNDGDDLLSGGDGNDTLTAWGPFTIQLDSLAGGSGTDTAVLRAQVRNFSAAHSSIEIVQGDYGIVHGTSGDDVIDLAGATTINQGVIGIDGIDLTGATTFMSGVIAIQGGDGNDTLTGTSGNDNLDGGTGDDMLFGGGGNDAFTWNFGDDRLSGGDGDDLLTAWGALTIQLDSLAGGSGTDTAVLRAKVHNFSAAHSSIEIVQGDFGIINGTAGDDVIDLTGATTGGAVTLNGGSGNDTLTAGAIGDALYGQSGSDTFADTLANLAGDTVGDFTQGDHILLTDTQAAGLTFALGAAGLTVLGKTIALPGFSGRLALGADSGGHAVFSVASDTARSDFNGDGHSDVVFRNVNGAISTWTVTGSGTQMQQGVYNGAADPSWKIVETFDMNGDGRSDILWRQDGGAVAVWGSTGAAFNGSTFYRPGAVPIAWQIVATGDLDGDGKDDILWQNADGAISSWKSTGTGFAENNYSHASVGAGWHVAGLGDFNGDGKADLLWRNDNGAVAEWTNSGAGTSFNEAAFYQSGVPVSWHVGGVGDFNGDGKDDIVWRNDGGALSIWLSDGTGFAEGVYNTSVPTGWHIAQVGDLNAEGRADILWRNDNGSISTWQSNGTGFDQAVYNGGAPTSWGVVAHQFPL